MPALINLIGKTFDRATVIQRNRQIQKEKNDKEVWWDCQCSCGNLFSARGHDLRNGKIKSCGCLKKENTKKLHYKDLTGQQFGKLTVLKENTERKIDGRCVWVCQCECGNIIEISSKGLAIGTYSCGCVKSKGETKIISILQDLNIQFITQYAPSDCKNINQLKFDFYLPDNNIIIEYNGPQHYKAIDFLGGEERFITQQKTDNIKKEWCQNNNITLIEIPYTDYTLLTKKYLEKLIKE